MKGKTKIVGVTALLLMSAVTVAETTPQRPVTRIDFNKMIDDSGLEKREMQNSVGNKLDKKANANASHKQKKDDQRKVIDFVDVEIGLGDERPIVDRRFNSVGAPKIATLDYSHCD